MISDAKIGIPKPTRFFLFMFDKASSTGRIITAETIKNEKINSKNEKPNLEMLVLQLIKNSARYVTKTTPQRA